MLSIMVRGLVLSLLVMAVFGDRVIFHDCGSLYDLQAVSIDGCSRTLPCLITVGAETNVRAIFVAAFSSSILSQDVVIEVNAVHKKLRVSPDPYETTWSPLVPLGTFTLDAVMVPPTSIALGRRGTLEWRVFNEAGDMVLCYSVMVMAQTIEQRDLLIARDINAHIFNNTVDNMAQL